MRSLWNALDTLSLIATNESETIIITNDFLLYAKWYQSIWLDSDEFSIIFPADTMCAKEKQIENMSQHK